MQFCHDAFFPLWSVSMGPWYPFSYMIAMNIDLYGQLSDWFILWIIIHAYEADRSCVNTMTIDMNSKDCWYEHVIVNMNINITQMNPHKQPMSYKWTDDRWYESQLSYLISWHFHVIMNDFMTPKSLRQSCAFQCVRVGHSKTWSCVFPFCFCVVCCVLGVTEAELCFPM